MSHTAPHVQFLVSDSLGQGKYEVVFLYFDWLCLCFETPLMVISNPITQIICSISVYFVSIIRMRVLWNRKRDDLFFNTWKNSMNYEWNLKDRRKSTVAFVLIGTPTLTQHIHTSLLSDGWCLCPCCFALLSYASLLFVLAFVSFLLILMLYVDLMNILNIYGLCIWHELFS